MDLQKILELFQRLAPLFEKLEPIIAFILKLVGGNARPAGPGKPGPGAGSGDPLDEDVSDPTQRERRPTSIDVQFLRIVLSAKRFPKEDREGKLILDNPRSYEGGGNAIPYNSKLTLDSELHDAQGGIPVQQGSPLSHTTAFYCQRTDVDEPAAVVGPGTGSGLALKDSPSVGVGGRNYDVNSHGMIATFRLAAEGHYKLWAENGGVRSREIIARTN